MKITLCMLKNLEKLELISKKSHKGTYKPRKWNLRPIRSFQTLGPKVLGFFLTLIRERMTLVSSTYDPQVGLQVTYTDSSNFFQHFCSLLPFQMLKSNFLGTMEPKVVHNKRFQSRIWDKSPEYSGLVDENPVAQTDLWPHDRPRHALANIVRLLWL